MVLLNQKYLTKTLQIAPTVKELNLDDNEITEIGKLALPNLEKLSLRNNQITNLDFTKILPTLKDLNVSNNLITRLPKTWEHENLKKLRIKSNPKLNIKNLPIYAPNLNKLWIDEDLADQNTELIEESSITHLNDTRIKKSKITESMVENNHVTIESFVQERKEVPKAGIYVPKIENEYGYSNAKDSGLVDKKTHKNIRKPQQISQIETLFEVQKWN